MRNKSKRCSLPSSLLVSRLILPPSRLLGEYTTRAGTEAELSSRLRLAHKANVAGQNLFPGVGGIPSAQHGADVTRCDYAVDSDNPERIVIAPVWDIERSRIRSRLATINSFRTADSVAGPGVRMNFAALFEKLLEIEKAAATGDYCIVHGLVVEAEGLMLDLERQAINLLENRAAIHTAPQKLNTI
jgi:hypothetical protein